MRRSDPWWRRWAFFSALSLISLFSLPAGAELPKPRPESFASKVEPNRVALGRTFLYLVEIRHPATETYSLPSPLTLGSMAIRDVSVERAESGTSIKTSIRIEGALYDALGEVALSELRLSVRDAEGGELEDLVIPGPTLFIIETSEGDELAPLPDSMDVRVVAWDRIAWVVSILALIALAIFLMRRRRGEELGVTEKEAVIPPGERALEALARLGVDALWEKGEERLHYFMLSEILRRYVSETQGFPASEMTSDEFLVEIRRRPVPGLELVAMESWIRRGDLVRFAKGRVDASAARADLQEAVAFVEAMEQARMRTEAEGDGSVGEASA